MLQPPADYPAQWESDVVLADGSPIHLRPIRPGDRELIRAFHARQSSESIYLRYFTPRPTLSERDLDGFTTVDYRTRMAFVGLLGDDLVGVARYDGWPGRDDAEVAFMVDDENHGRGIATVMLEFLAEAARQVGIRRFSAQVLPSNRKMLSVFKQAGFETTTEFGDGVIEVMLGIDPTPEASAAMEERGHVAEARSVARLLAPQSVAVIGAGRRPGGLGHEVVINLLAAGFRGPVYPVNPAADRVAGLVAYDTILDVPAAVDQAVIAVPAAAVPEAVLACARARVQSLVILSSGFSETGPTGAAVEHDLVSLARRYGMRVVGPNCLGVINTDPAVRLHSSSTAATPQGGRIGLLSQSGALGTAILEHASAFGVGVSTFVEAGNKADVSANDLLQYWEDDERTDVVMLHLESFGNPRRFSRIVRRVARIKPVVAVKSASVTTAWAEDDRLQSATIDALLGQMGVIRVDAIEAMFDVARILLHQPHPKGRRVAILANAGGPALLAADACRGAGLELANLSAPTLKALASAMPAAGVAPNPVDLTHHAGPADYEAAIATVAADPDVDSLLVIYAPPLTDQTATVVAAITNGARKADTADKPVVATVLGMGATDLRAVEGGTIRAVPSFTFPERAARALAAVSRYGEWLGERPGVVAPLADVDTAVAEAIVGDHLARHPDGVVLRPEAAVDLLAAYGLAVVPRLFVSSASEAARAARTLGYPVTLKATGLEHLGKTEAAGVALDLHRADEVRRAYGRMNESLGDAMRPALVQPMVAPGVDLAIGLHQHPSVGGVVVVGLGGAASAGAHEAAVRVLPLTDLDLDRLLATSPLRGWLAGAERPVGADALAEVLHRLAGLADDLPEVAELRVNPLIVSEHAAELTDVFVRLAPWRRDDSALRRL